MLRRSYSLLSYAEIPIEKRREFLVNHPRDEQYTYQLLPRVVAEVVAGVRGVSGDDILRDHYEYLISVLETNDGEIVFKQPNPNHPVYTAWFTHGTNVTSIMIRDNGVGNPFQVNLSTVLPEEYDFKTTFGLDGLRFV